MNEDFLHFIWKYRNFNSPELKTTDGQTIKIIKPGEHNTHAGPDFLNAQLMIGDTHWAGNVEMHLKTSDWVLHKHSEDPTYENIILHAVYEHDMDNPVPAGRPLATLKSYIDQNTIAKYETLKQQHGLIPCESQISSVNEMVKANWLDRMLAERLETKAALIKRMLDLNKNDWAETAYQLTGRNFGFKVNAEPFERLTRAVPHKLLARHKNNLMQIEALLFGQAGFLGDMYEDAYLNELKKEYKFLAGKYNLTPGRKSDWKFLRLRPGNFLTLRISQFAALAFRSEHLFSKILDVTNIKEAIDFFKVSANDYWKEHYMPDTKSASKGNAALGKESAYNLVINTVAPILFSYGHIRNEPKYKETAISLLENCPRELNTITKSSMMLGFENKHASQSQALIHLRNMYCAKQQCLACGIGAAILKQN